MSPPLRGIFFDIDDTLCCTSEFTEKARSAALDAMIEAGLAVDKQLLEEELAEVIKEFSSNYEHHLDKLLVRIPRRHYRGMNTAVLIAAGVIAYHENKMRYLAPYEDAYEVLKLLSKTDLVLGVITEGLEVKQAEKLVRMRVHNFLTPNAIFVSNQIGISKPNPKIYQRACSDLNLRPTEVMYVGDNPQNDIDPPNKIGMMSARMRRGKYAQLESETPANIDVQNFWDLLDHLRQEFSLDV